MFAQGCRQVARTCHGVTSHEDNAGRHVRIFLRYLFPERAATASRHAEITEDYREFLLGEGIEARLDGVFDACLVAVERKEVGKNLRDFTFVVDDEDRPGVTGSPLEGLFRRRFSFRVRPGQRQARIPG